MSKKTLKSGRSVKYAFPIEFSPGHTARNLSIRPDGTLLVTDDDGQPVLPISAGRITSYERPKGPKVQMQFLGLPGFVSLGGLIELTEYERVIITDANSCRVGDEWITACCCIDGRFVRATETSVRFQLTDPFLHFLELRGVQGNPEMLAILQITTAIAA